jgi:hypothetical protein
MALIVPDMGWVLIPQFPEGVKEVGVQSDTVVGYNEKGEIVSIVIDDEWRDAGDYVFNSESGEFVRIPDSAREFSDVLCKEKESLQENYRIVGFPNARSFSSTYYVVPKELAELVVENDWSGPYSDDVKGKFMEEFKSVDSALHVEGISLFDGDSEIGKFSEDGESFIIELPDNEEYVVPVESLNLHGYFKYEVDFDNRKSIPIPKIDLVVNMPKEERPNFVSDDIEWPSFVYVDGEWLRVPDPSTIVGDPDKFEELVTSAVSRRVVGDEPGEGRLVEHAVNPSRQFCHR